MPRPALPSHALAVILLLAAAAARAQGAAPAAEAPPSPAAEPASPAAAPAASTAVAVEAAAPAAAPAQVVAQPAPQAPPPAPAAPVEAAAVAAAPAQIVAQPAPQAAPPAPAAPAPRQQTWRLSASAGAGAAYGESYFLLGARLGYALRMGFELSVDGQLWMGSTPGMGKVAPGINWYLPVPRLSPYVGAYYARWFVGSNFDDENAIGGRAGLTFGSAGPAALSVGASYEHLLSCSQNCDSWWPEVAAGVRF